MASARQHRDLRAETLFWVVAAIPVSLVLLVPQLVVQDGGLHLASAAAMEGLLVGRWPDLLVARPGLHPNLLVELLLLALVQVLDGNWALRVVVVLALVGFAAAGRAIARASGAPIWAALLFLPFAMHYMVLLGFIGFAVAVPIGMAAVAVVLRAPQRPPTVRVAVLLTLCWFTHLIPAVLLTVAVVLVVAFAQPRPGEMYRAVLPAVPVIVLTAGFVLSTAGGGVRFTRDPVASAVEVLGMTLPMAAYADLEYEIIRGLALGLWLLAGTAFVVRLRRRRFDHRDGLLVSAALFAALAIVVDQDTDAGTYLNSRIALFVPLLMVAWLLTVGPELLEELPPLRRPAVVGLVAVLGVVATTGLAAVRYPALSTLGSELAQMRTLASCVPPGATLVQVGLSHGSPDAVRVVPMAEQAGHLALDRDALDLGNESGRMPFYLWNYTGRAVVDRDLATVPGGVNLVPAQVDLAGAMARGFPVDAVVLFGRPFAEPEVIDDPGTPVLLNDLEGSFDRVAVAGASEVWLRSGVMSTCAVRE